jgi:hypothetical protein
MMLGTDPLPKERVPMIPPVFVEVTLHEPYTRTPRLDVYIALMKEHGTSI